MALGSQSPREMTPGRGKSYMSSRRRQRKLPWLVLLAIGCVAAGVYLAWPSGDAGDSALDTDAAGVDAGPGNDDQATMQSVVNNQPRPAPPSPRAARPTPADEPPAPEADPPAPPPALPVQHISDPARTAAPARARLDQAMADAEAGRLITARLTLSDLLLRRADQLAVADMQRVRDRLDQINAELLWSGRAHPDDDTVESYNVQPGDLLSRIAPRYRVPYQLIERINDTPASRLQAGRDITVLRGPVHARVIKHHFMMDLYVVNPAGDPVYVASYPVGLGEGDSTPAGQWLIAEGSKVTNPSWRNPRTGEYFGSDDPDNPIGEFWLAMTGQDEATTGRSGYGIHGTIDPDSVGRMMSMGCIRLVHEDIEAVFEMLEDGHSRVTVLP